jgi:hypothetical protein
VAFFEGFGVVAFAPVTDFGPEASGDQVTGGGSAGRVGCVRVQEVGGQGDGAGGAEAFGFVGKDLRVLPGDGPRAQGVDGRRQGADLAGLGDERPGGGGADGQDSGDFLNCGHLGVGPLVHGRFRRGHGVLDFDGLGRVPGLDGGELGFDLLHGRHPVQADLILPLQHIHPGPGTGAGSQGGILNKQRVQARDGGVNALHH